MGILGDTTETNTDTTVATETAETTEVAETETNDVSGTTETVETTETTETATNDFGELRQQFQEQQRLLEQMQNERSELYSLVENLAKDRNKEAEVDPLEEFGGDLEPSERERVRKLNEALVKQQVTPLNQQIEQLNKQYQEASVSNAVNSFKARHANDKDFPYDKISPHMKDAYQVIQSGDVSKQLEMARLSVIGAMHLQSIDTNRKAEAKAQVSKKATKTQADALSNTTSVATKVTDNSGKGSTSGKSAIERWTAEAMKNPDGWFANFT